MSLPLLHLVSTRDGQMLAPRFDRYVGLSLDMYGEYSREERELLVWLLNPGDVLVQAGSNVGALTIPLARAVGSTGKVFAIEPQELCYRALIANAALNDLWHVEAIRAAVGATNGVASLPLVDYASTGNFGGVSLATEETSIRVPLVTIDKALAHVDRCALLHIDVEGSEMDALAGAVAFVARTRPALCIEIDRPHVREALPAWLEANGYVGFEHHPALYSSDNWRGITRNVFEDSSHTPIVSLNCIAFPKEQTLSMSKLQHHFAVQPFPYQGKPDADRD